MHQRGAVCAEFALDPVQPQHRLSLALGDRLARAGTIDIFAGRIHRLWAPLSPLPIVLEGAPAAVLRLVDLVVRVQPAERIAADRPDSQNLLARIERERIVDLHLRHLGIERYLP